ncbi:cysteine desulfurase/selenocysteine lyase [Gibbsiella quercinecans]|uniref:cysteine desulfurase n=1 Tax=Gibbsiella quercinecans TaxID=929813 RepID=A0A250AYU3_9GAMM|nr:cysteine desulfurase [Gibbsiella quercinecans]ATA19140.1 cysteine desulfurase [Gibbsiella quercinecans]RLM03709.1 cysteine desulfurase [Gibbsiella quercinecans]RLM10962.1 cysteine desulfurase [Gibbsiella quercinecans]TCT87647.1 cysteine desulfurase/selenocysteine lyase [Gibbsiella quercinecans]
MTTNNLSLPGWPGSGERSPSARDYGLPDERDLHALLGERAPKPHAPDPAYAPQVVPYGQNSATAVAPRPGVTPSSVPAPLARVGQVPVEHIRADFPILAEQVDGKPLVWLDNAATTQRPRQVIERISHFYLHENSNIHRAAHTLAARSTDAYEAARDKVARFIGAGSSANIVFVRGTTEGLNLIAQSYVKPLLRPGDEIILTLLEHHANIVPWQLVAQETGAVLRVAPVDENGQLILEEYSRLFNDKTRFVSATHVSNALGTVTPVQELVAIAHRFGVRIAIDGAQSISHIPVNVTTLDADFFVFSGHKVFGPTGIGVVYGKQEVLDEARPYQGGGNMIADVTFELTRYQPAPNKFEAGTGNIADAVGLGAAIDYVTAIGITNIAQYEHALLEYGIEKLTQIPGLKLIGTAAQKTSVLSFVLEGHENEAIGRYLSQAGIAVRAGHHCAQPILRHFGYETTVRPSLAFYNTPQEIDFLAEKITLLATGSRR